MLKIKEGEIEYLVLDRHKSSQDVLALFEDINFPLPLYELTKRDLLDEYKRLGLEHIIPMTWFCHTHIRNVEPCGFCLPCQQVVKSKMEFRLSASAINRYRMKKWLPSFIWRIIRKNTSKCNV